MKILLFGKNGMVGREVAQQAKATGYQITALGRGDADFSDPNDCAEIVVSSDADVIINAAAYTAVDRAEDESDLAHIVNGETPGAIAKAAAEKKMPVVHISTDYVFSATHDQPYKPSDAVDPINAYGASKLVGEQAIAAADGNHVILRTSWVFSADGNNFVKTMLRLSETKNGLGIVADQIGGPTSAQSIAAACLEIAVNLNDGARGGIHHLSGSPDVSWSDFAREIFRQAGREVAVNDIATSDYPTPAKRPLNSRLDCGSLKTEFGIDRPDWRLDLEKTLKELEITDG